MTLLTEQGRPPGQHGRMVAAMSLVTERTLLGDRRVLPKVGTALFSMAGVAIVIDVVGIEQKIAVAVVHVMAVAAGHLAKPQRMP